MKESKLKPNGKKTCKFCHEKLWCVHVGNGYYPNYRRHRGRFPRKPCDIKLCPLLKNE